MYMSILGKSQDLYQYPHVLLTSPHELDPTVLDYAYPNTHGYPSWAPDPSVRDQYDPSIDEWGNIHSRAMHTLSILSDSPITSIQKHVQQPTTIDYNKVKCILVGSMLTPSRKCLTTPLNGLSHPLDCP